MSEIEELFLANIFQNYYLLISVMGKLFFYCGELFNKLKAYHPSDCSQIDGMQRNKNQKIGN